MAIIKTNARSASALDATILSGNLPSISGASLTGISAGKVVAVSTAVQSSSFQTNNSSYTDVTGLSLDYTMQSSSNKIIFTVHGDTQRGTQDGGTGSVLEFDGSEIYETIVEDPACADNTYLPYGSAIIDGYSGSKNFKGKIRSTPGNSKCLSRTGSTLTVIEYTP